MRKRVAGQRASTSRGPLLCLVHASGVVRFQRARLQGRAPSGHLGREIALEFEHRQARASRAARTLLGRIEAQRRQARADALLARADAAIVARDFAVAVGLLREARALDVQSEETLTGIVTRLAQAETAARDQLAQARVSEVAALLTQERLEEGLLAYLGLNEAQRAEIRRTHGVAMLGWLEEMGAPPAGARAQAAVQAVQALARAVAALARDDGHAAEAEIAAHVKMLQKVPAWRAVQEDAAEAIARSERARSQEELARIAALLDTGGDPAQARALVDAIDPRWLGEPARVALEALRARLAYAESRALIETRIERALARGDLLDARDTADAGLALALPGERLGGASGQASRGVSVEPMEALSRRGGCSWQTRRMLLADAEDAPGRRDVTPRERRWRVWPEAAERLGRRGDGSWKRRCNPSGEAMAGVATGVEASGHPRRRLLEEAM